MRDLPVKPGRLAMGGVRSGLRRIRRLVACALLLAPGACSQEGGDGIIWHPIADSLAGAEEGAVVVMADTAAPVSPSLRDFARQLRSRATEVNIGVAEGEEPYIFGTVGDADFLADGSLAVLDRQAMLVRVFTEDGVYRTTVGGPGEGPGELSVPLALITPGPDALWIVDGPVGLHRFLRDAEQWEFQDRVRLVGSTYHRDGCAVGGTVVVHGNANADGSLLYVPGRAEGQERAFGSPYRYGNPFVVTQVARGQLACAGDGLVLLAHERINRVTTYDLGSGRAVRQTIFDGVRMPPIKEMPDRRGVGLEAQGLPFFHGLLGVAGGRDGPLVVQYARRTAQDLAERREDRYDIDTYVLDPATGQGLYVGDQVPQILALLEDRLALLVSSPYPRLEIATLGR